MGVTSHAGSMASNRMQRHLVLCFVLFASWIFAGCAAETNLGTNDRDANGGMDAAVGSRSDQCGNGLDDDRDSRIDEGCPCGPGERQSCFPDSLATRRVGSCADGIQECVSDHLEWGDWGNSPCEGAIGPSAEQCDGMDHDCDGALDNGCSCGVGDTRPCGSGLPAPCAAGVQRCGENNAWSSCEGAVFPSAEICGDGIDNDCDGHIDTNCDCVPEPERCRDGLDNDCDGVVDEPACTPDWLMCMPIAAGAPRTAMLAASVQGTSTPSIAVAWNTDARELGVLYVRNEVRDGAIAATELRILRLGADARVRGEGLITRASGDSLRAGGLAWNGAKWIATWVGPPSRAYAVMAGPDGSPEDEPIGISALERSARNPTILAAGSDVFLAWSEVEPSSPAPADVHIGHYVLSAGTSLTPVASAITLGAGAGWIDLAWSGDALGVLDVSSPQDGTSGSTTARFSLVRNDEIVAQHEYSISSSVSMLMPPALAFGAAGYLACWPGTATAGAERPMRCIRVSSAGAFEGDPFDATPPATVRVGDIAWNGCRFVAYTARHNALTEREQYLSTIGVPTGMERFETLSFPHGDMVFPVETHVVPMGGGALLLVQFSRTRADGAHLDLRIAE